MESKLSDKRKERRKHNSNLEVSGTQEFFTPKFLCDEMLDKIPEEDWKDFLTRFLESSIDKIITSTDKEHTILKKYEMQRFTSQSEADKVIADFAKLVKDYTGVEFFKENFY